MIRIGRRGVLGVGLGAAAGLYFGTGVAAGEWDSYPFTLGVASGAPTPTGVTLWTRLAPSPLEIDGGLAPRALPVHWQVSDDERFTTVVQQGTAIAYPEAAHSVRVDVTGLAPDRWYFYRFRCGRALSRVGRTRTLPAAGAAVSALRMAIASCQRFEDGYYTAYRDMAARDLDLVLQVGDYIYDDVFTTGVHPRLAEIPNHLRATATDLQSYRLRHALYRLDPDLQDAHAAAPWLVIPDNHDAVEDGDPALLQRRAAAYQAYYEHLPMSAAAHPDGPSMRIHHSVDFGGLARLHLLDTRQFRDDQYVCGTELIGAACAALDDPQRSMLGANQERWLRRSLGRTGAAWNPIVQTVLFAPYDFAAGADREVYYASWDGYPAARQRLLDDLAATRPRNPVMLSADWHTAWVNNVPADRNLDGPPVLTEFLTTGISSAAAFTSNLTKQSLPENPQVRFYDENCGYTLCTITASQWRTDFVAADTGSRDGSVHTISSWVIESGRAQADQR
ncbi:alkaline phosphatase D family protein [Saccharopolyspora sp. 5N708]|uniref:alkaline phosphatase D family protein n=1 Tax=Saccharopolyspora sp. 5N708 TaxID=3457424 RepID=UPI003FD4E42B